ILEGEIDKKKLERTFRQLIHRHESLRTSFHIIGDEPVQNIHDNVKFEIEKLDGRVDPLWSPFIRPFALSQAPLLRVGLLKEKEARHILMVDMHHIISDGTSMNILVKDFMALYQGKHLSELQLQYKDFSNWQQDEKQAESLKRQEEFWLNEFAAEIPVLELHVDYQRPAVQSFEGSRIQFEIDKETTAILKALTLKKGATLYILLLTLYTVFLSKVTGQEEIIIGSPIAGRRHADLEKIIGMFVNTLALRNYPVGEKKFPDFLEEVKEKTLKAFENQDYQYELLVEKVAVTRDTSRNPLFDTMFALQNIDSQNIDIPGLKIFPYPYENKTAKFDLSLSAVEWEEKLLFDFEFSTKLFKEETINRFIAYFRNIVNGVIENKERKIADFEILTEEEKRQILGDFNDTAAQYPRDITIHQLFEEQALKSPDHVAVFGHGQTRTNTDKNNVGAGPRVCPVNLTYRQLNEQSDRLANSLIEKGVLPDTIVGIMMERSVEIIIGILGILKSGGAYLPIDPEYPQERIDYMLKDSAAKLLVVANDQECEKVRRWGGEKMILKSIPHLSNYSFYQHSAFITQHSNHLCYIIYTSGSTGKPKGVLIQHDNFVNATFGWREEYKLDKIEVNLLQMASFSFDVSCGDISRALINGGKLIICSNDVKLNFPILYDYIDMHRVTLFESTPSLVIPFMDFIHENKLKLNYLQLLIIGSDSFRFTDYQKLQSQYGKSIRIINSYGVTEATIDSTYYESIDEDGGLTISEFVPIGKPMPNVKCFILDSYCRIQPIGISGELFITGSSISRGYANRPELTCKKFKIINYKLKIINGSGDLRADLDAYSAEENFHHSAFDIPRTQHSNFYATGDLARWLPDGSIEFLGRIDHQIKIRGFRLELGEIESHLCSHGAVKKGIVRARDDGYGNRYLCAYVVMEDKTGVQGLKEYLKKKLPDYMIPMYFVPLAKIPLTLNGKVDSRALPEPAALEPDSNYIAPRDHIEIKLAEIWSGVLKINQSAISIDDDFFQVGGHSLRATIVISNIHKELNIKLPLVEIFKSPTIRALAHYIKGKTQDKFMAIPAVEKMEYYPLSPAQGRLYFLQQITEGNTGYNEYSVVEIVGQVDKCKLEETFKKLIDRHESFRTYFVKVGDEIRQRVAPIVDFVVDYEEEENEKLETVLDHFIRPFDLGKAPLLRVKLVRFNVEHYWMLYDMHHIITDGTSTAVLLKEFVSFYVGESLEPLRIQYKDFSLWQDGVEGKAALKKQESYWLKEFQAEIPVLQLCTDYPRPELQRFAGDRLNFILGEKETKTLKVFTLKQDVTLFMLLLGVYNVLLSRLSGQEDIIVGTPIAARRHADLQCIIGMFVNTLALRNYPVGDKRFIDFLGEIKNRTLAAFENQEYPFEELVEKVKVPRNLGRNPVFDIIIAVQNMESQVAGIPEARIDDIEIKLPQFFYKIAKFDLSMHVIETGETLAFILEYSTSLFKKETVEQFYHYFVRAALAAAGDPLMKIYELEIISNDEKRQILYGFNDTDAEYPWEKTIYGVFKEQAVRTPDFTAVIDNDALVTYRELNEKSDRLSYLLRLRRVGTNTIVGIMAERSIAMIQGIFAILKTGGAYLPIEPDYPGKRVDFILADAGVEIVLTQQSFPERILKNCEKIFLDGRQPYAVDKSYACLANKPGDLIYIIY
ncbi:MAG TPA: amino acid adenylation domain-containing protein, partial [Candidatus Kapabacteria bacterium]|nr:amino acid adenylation domain-containing protein [Candidatus Kapabacteria bacterium]